MYPMRRRKERTTFIAQMGRCCASAEGFWLQDGQRNERHDGWRLAFDFTDFEGYRPSSRRSDGGPRCVRREAFAFASRQARRADSGLKRATAEVAEGRGRIRCVNGLDISAPGRIRCSRRLTFALSCPLRRGALAAQGDTARSAPPGQTRCDLALVQRSP